LTPGGSSTHLHTNCTPNTEDGTHITITKNIHNNYAVNIMTVLVIIGVRGGAVGLGTLLQAGRSRVQFPMVSLEFFIDIILPAALWPWVDSASSKNDYQEYFLGVKAAGV
jgi:hypothetical protein